MSDKKCPFISSILPIPKPMPKGIIRGQGVLSEVEFIPSVSSCINENCMFWDTKCLIAEACKNLCKNNIQPAPEPTKDTSDESVIGSILSGK